MFGNGSADGEFFEAILIGCVDLHYVWNTSSAVFSHLLHISLECPYTVLGCEDCNLACPYSAVKGGNLFSQQSKPDWSISPSHEDTSEDDSHIRPQISPVSSITNITPQSTHPIHHDGQVCAQSAERALQPPRRPQKPKTRHNQTRIQPD